MHLLDKIVKNMLEEHVGGEKFFDNLDAKLQNKEIVYSLFELLPKKSHIIVSGKFGIFFSNLYSHKEDIIITCGGLRSGIGIPNFSYLSRYIAEAKDFVFVDDSFYSGKTRNAIKEELERHGGNLLHTYVIYDGSPKKDVDVSSLFRYYDKYQTNEER